MRLFIDSSNPKLWDKYRRSGWAYGATTNPLILQKEGRPCTMDTFRDLVAAAKDTGLRELQIQTTGATTDAMVANGHQIANLWEKIVVKVPFTENGLAAASDLKGHGVRITMTAAYAVHQMIVASALSTAYIAPYFGRLIEAGKDGDAIVDGMLAIRACRGPRVLVASIRTIEQLEALAIRGHDTFTLNPDLCARLGQSGLSDKAAIDFEIAGNS